GGDVLEPAVVAGVLEEKRRDAFLDDDRSSPVFHLIDESLLAALAAEQLGPCDRGPPKDGGVGEMEDVVEPVAAGVVGVVSESATHRLAAVSHFDAFLGPTVTTDGDDVDRERSGQPFGSVRFVVK